MLGCMLECRLESKLEYNWVYMLEGGEEENKRGCKEKYIWNTEKKRRLGKGKNTFVLSKQSKEERMTAVEKEECLG